MGRKIGDQAPNQHHEYPDTERSTPLRADWEPWTGRWRKTVAIKKILCTMACAFLIVAITLACINATPSECIEAAEEAGLPEDIIDQLKSPGDLNVAERLALNRALSRAGIADICSGVAEEQDEGPSEAERTAEPERPAPEMKLSARIPEDEEDHRRCRFWALNNLRPIVFEEFSQLDPENMDDLDRILWRSILHPQDHLGFYDNNDAGGNEIPSLRPREPGIYCRDYWAEPLGSKNADLRNHGFETQCRRRLEERISDRYHQLAAAASHNEDNDLVWETPNQYVRILQWLDTSGEELLDSDRPPYMILREQSRHPYAHMRDRVPDEDLMADYRREWDREVNPAWLGILSVAGMTDNSSDLRECHFFYPQVFYGYWIPFDPDAVPGDGDDQETGLVEYNPSTMPILLPETVDSPRVRAGYPLGMIGEQYHRCSGESEAEEAGYYFVDHPTGAYCEKIQ